MRMMMKMMDLIHCHFGLWDHKLYDFAVQFVKLEVLVFGDHRLYDFAVQFVKLEGALLDLQILLLFWLYLVNDCLIFE